MRVLEFKQAAAPEPDFDVAGVVEMHEGLSETLLLVRELDQVGDDRPAGIESRGGEW